MVKNKYLVETAVGGKNVHGDSFDVDESGNLCIKLGKALVAMFAKGQWVSIQVRKAGV